MAGRLELEFGFSQPEAQTAYRQRREGAMRILVMGDFSGRSNRGLLEHGGGLAERPIVPVDIDNYEALMFRFAPQLQLPLVESTGQGLTIGFQQLEDFHPDGLYKRLEVFQALRRIRVRLQDPASFEEAVAELQGALPAVEIQAAEGPAEESQPEDDGAMLERLLGRRPVDSPQARLGGESVGQGVDLTPFIKQIIAPHIAPSAPPHQDIYIASVDEAISEQMRAILHHPAFQSLESAWRSLYWLVSNLETGEDLKLFMLDVTKEELAADIQAAAGDMTASGLHRLLVEQGVGTMGGEPWSLLAGNYSFGVGAGDVALLAAMGMIAAQAGGPFVAAAHPEILGCKSVHEVSEPRGWQLDDEDRQRWQALRNSPAASWIGLTLPRLLLRLPYGDKTDVIEAFEFEEFAKGAKHEAYLWGNPAFASALLIGKAFQQRGWSMQPGDFLDIEDLPAHTYRVEGEAQMKPCAEVSLSERAMEAILSRGIMPLLSHPNCNVARLARFQSVAEPSSALSGAWA